MKIIVIGAGIFGVTIALELAKHHRDVTLVEANNNIMQNASKVNHSRLHFGFHYPRSEKTARQCLDGYGLFNEYFESAITSNFPNYYMIEKSGKVDSSYYEMFCENLNLEYEWGYPDINMDFSNIESSYLTKEPIFDYDLINQRLLVDLIYSRVKVVARTNISSADDLSDYDVVVNATYFNINKIKKLFGIETTPLKLQVVVIPILKCNMEKIGVTIMDGEFCSVMPKGFNNNAFLLYHVKESVVFQTEGYEIPKPWRYGKRMMKNDLVRKNIYDKTVAKRNIRSIVGASKKYFKFLDECDFDGYWQTVRALPINDNDERLSVFDVTERDNKKIISVLSGKVSTCLLMAKKISKLI